MFFKLWKKHERALVQNERGLVIIHCCEFCLQDCLHISLLAYYSAACTMSTSDPWRWNEAVDSGTEIIVVASRHSQELGWFSLALLDTETDSLCLDRNSLSFFFVFVFINRLTLVTGDWQVWFWYRNEPYKCTMWKKINSLQFKQITTIICYIFISWPN